MLCTASDTFVLPGTLVGPNRIQIELGTLPGNSVAGEANGKGGILNNPG